MVNVPVVPAAALDVGGIVDLAVVGGIVGVTVVGGIVGGTAVGVRGLDLEPELCFEERRHVPDLWGSWRDCTAPAEIF
jgi:hypothetical protein